MCIQFFRATEFNFTSKAKPQTSAADFFLERKSLKAFCEAAADCKACDFESTLAPWIMATVHPSSILRASDDEIRQAEKRRFIDDLKRVAGVLSKTK